MSLSDLIKANRKSLFKISALYVVGVGLAFLPVNLFPTNDWAIIFSLFMTLVIAPTNDFFGNIVDSLLSITTSYFFPFFSITSNLNVYGLFGLICWTFFSWIVDF